MPDMVLLPLSGLFIIVLAVTGSFPIWATALFTAFGIAVAVYGLARLFGRFFVLFNIND